MKMLRLLLQVLPFLHFLLNIDPRLTARHGGGHVPIRIVMSRTLNLPEVANLWDVSSVPTIVVTQRGARKSFQKFLASKGVEVVEFDILNTRDVMEYFYDRGYLSILWECGGTLAASAISSGIIHKVLVSYEFISNVSTWLFILLLNFSQLIRKVIKRFIVYPRVLLKSIILSGEALYKFSIRVEFLVV